MENVITVGYYFEIFLFNIVILVAYILYSDQNEYYIHKVIILSYNLLFDNYKFILLLWLFFYLLDIYLETEALHSSIIFTEFNSSKLTVWNIYIYEIQGGERGRERVHAISELQ